MPLRRRLPDLRLLAGHGDLIQRIRPRVEVDLLLRLRGHTGGKRVRGNAREHYRTTRDDGMWTHFHPVNQCRTDADRGAAPHGDEAGEISARSDVYEILQHAIVADRAAAIQERITSDDAAGADNGASADDRAFAVCALGEITAVA